MLTRRHIREKVMKALYAFFQSNNSEIAAGEKELFHSIDRVYDVYLFYLALLPELKEYAIQLIEDRKAKRLPTEEDLNPLLNFVNNKVIDLMEHHSDLHAKFSKAKINWNGHQDLIKKLYYSFKDEAWFRLYLVKADPSFEDDKEILHEILLNSIIPSEGVQQFFEDRSIYWLDDIEIMQAGVLKTIKNIKADSETPFRLQLLHKEAEEDRKFASELLRKTIVHSDEYHKEIAARTQNWEIDRVAKMDIILMKMAICELIEFTSIPVKVTLDEYIEMSKDYSSPQSKTFINGILDKIVADFKRDNKISKAGRGLVE
jgi:transcription antitermination protein NusB